MTWSPGDLAQCINPNGWMDMFHVPGSGPARNQILIVDDAILDTDCGLVGLMFNAWPGKLFHEAQFRKLDGSGPEIEERAFHLKQKG